MAWRESANALQRQRIDAEPEPGDGLRRRALRGAHRRAARRRAGQVHATGPARRGQQARPTGGAAELLQIAVVEAQRHVHALAAPAPIDVELADARSARAGPTASSFRARPPRARERSSATTAPAGQLGPAHPQVASTTCSASVRQRPSSARRSARALRSRAVERDAPAAGACLGVQRQTSPATACRRAADRARRARRRRGRRCAPPRAAAWPRTAEREAARRRPWRRPSSRSARSTCASARSAPPSEAPARRASLPTRARSGTASEASAVERSRPNCMRACEPRARAEDAHKRRGAAAR